MKMKLKWENKDWFWLLFLIVFVTGTSYMYKKEVMNLISYTSTFVSIALAFIAIYISVREATKTDKIKDETLSTLVEIRERISQVDTKVSSIDFTSISTLKERVDQVVNNITDKVQEDNKGEEHTDTPEDQLINEKVKDKWAELSEEFKEQLNNELVNYLLSVERPAERPAITEKQVEIIRIINNSLQIVYDNLSRISQDGKFTFLSIYHELLTLNFLSQREIKSMGTDFKKRVNELVDQHVRSRILSVDSDGKYTFNGFRNSRI